MAGKYILGIDVGTQSIKVHLYDQNANYVAGGSVMQYIDTIKPMWATQKADFWWKSVVGIIRDILAKSAVNPEDIVSIGCCAHMHGVVPVAADGTVLMNDVQLYSDKRAADIAESLLAKDIDNVYEKTANLPTSNWFGIKIRSIKDNEPEVYARTHKFLTPKDYVNFMFTGNACIDPSEGIGSFAMDRHTLQWSDYLIRNIGIDREKLPDVHMATEVVGTVSEKVAKETGLSSKTVVVCGAGDMMCSLFTAGLTNPGTVVDNTGTGSIICYFTKEPIMDRRIMNLYYLADGFVPFGNIDSSGGAFRWLRDHLAKKETDEARARGEDEYAALCRMAEKTPAGADGLLFFPYLMGERTMGTANSRGCYIGMNLGTDVAAMTRALLEGVAFEHKRTLDIFESTGNSVAKVFHVGGASKGDFWNQIKADIYEKPVYTLAEDEGGVLGAALAGSVGAGLFRDTAEASALVVKVGREYLPNKANSARYRAMYGAFCDLHDMLQSPFARLAAAAKI